MINKLTIDNFRGFRHLDLTGFQPVNLIVGKNNAGKTSLLESLAVLSQPQTMLQQLPSLFRPASGEVQKRFYTWLLSDGFDGQTKIEGVTDAGVIEVLMQRKPFAPQQKASGYLRVFNGSALIAYATKDAKISNCKCIPIRNMEPADLVRAFSQAVKQRNGEEIMEQVLRKVDPRVKKARTEVADDGNHVMVDLGFSQMLPLAQAGQGMYRLVSMLSGLIGDRPDIALVDEVDDGLHHSVLTDLWTGLAETAQLLGIQIFATTHSYECIQAAHDAFSARPNYGLGIIQLFRLEDHVEGRVLQKDQIEAALSGGIDLRN